MRIFLLLLLTILTYPCAKAGSITGIIPIVGKKTTSVPVGKYRGKISGKVKPAPAKVAAVWLERSGLSAPSKNKSIALAQKNYQFASSLIVIPKGTTVTFPNKDPDYHNIYSLSKTKRFDLGRYKAKETIVPSVLFDKAGFVALRCEIHEHMNANIVVVDSPYYVATDARGTFKLQNIPPGHYTLHAQMDRKTKWKMPVTVSAKKITKVQFPVK